MRYEGLNENEVMQKFVIAILKQAVTDISKLESSREKIDAERFLGTEYCELMCSAVGIDQAVFLVIADRKRT